MILWQSFIVLNSSVHISTHFPVRFWWPLVVFINPPSFSFKKYSMMMYCNIKNILGPSLIVMSLLLPHQPLLNSLQSFFVESKLTLNFYSNRFHRHQYNMHQHSLDACQPLQTCRTDLSWSVLTIIAGWSSLCRWRPLRPQPPPSGSGVTTLTVTTLGRTGSEWSDAKLQSSPKLSKSSLIWKILLFTLAQKLTLHLDYF